MMDFIRKHKIRILFLMIGAIGGFLYWHFIGCASGTCPITSKWYSSSAYGLLFGYLFSDFFTEKKKLKTEKKDE